jgi:hypothetical protein
VYGFGTAMTTGEAVYGGGSIISGQYCRLGIRRVERETDKEDVREFHANSYEGFNAVRGV